MAFMTSKTIVFKKKKTSFLTLFKFAFLFFVVYFIPSLVNYMSNETLLLSREFASYKILKLRVRYEFTGFDTDFLHKK